MQFAATRHHKLARALHILHAQRHVALQLVKEALADLTAGHKAALATREGAVIDPENHAHRRVLDLDRRQGDGIFRAGYRIADTDGCDPGKRDDIARVHFVDRLALEIAKNIDLADRSPFHLACSIDMHNGLARTQRTTAQTPNGDLADIGAVLQRRDQELRWAIDHDERRR